ncbi:MAG: alpha/beta hydrolase, partial [Candidatus Lokiarchaeota archaeon]
MALREILKEHKKKIFLIILFILPFIILIPGNFRIISPLLGKTSGYEVVIDRVSYTSEGFANNQSNLIIGNLYQPTPKYSNKTYPAIIFCPGYSLGFGKETSKRWAIELARRDFVVLSIDLPGNGMSIGNMDLLPRSDLEPKIIQGAINYLKNLSFVDSNDIGLLGYSYGGSAVLLSSGILGDQINATVSLNGFANFTNWLINGILPSLNIDFKVYSDNITLLNMNDQPITPQNIHEIDNLYGLFRGDTSTINNLIIPNSTALNRTFLKKFNAVDYLPNVRNDSVMFIHSLYDTTFHNTNQSGQGYKSIISHNKTAYYIPVKDGHDFTKDPNRTVDYCTINFFEEKLKNVSLGENWASPLAKYSQKRNITLTTDLYPFSSLMIQNGILYGFSFLPFIGFMYIIYQEKKVSTKRAMIDKE